MTIPAELLDCLSFRRLHPGFKTFTEMAAHRWTAHQVPIDETYADVDEPMPAEEMPSCAKPTATPPTIPTGATPGDDEEDGLDDEEHECPWCGEPCACPTGADEAGPGQPHLPRPLHARRGGPVARARTSTPRGAGPRSALLHGPPGHADLFDHHRRGQRGSAGHPKGRRMQGIHVHPELRDLL